MSEIKVSYWWVYILECADSTYYIGISNDVAKRLKVHNAKKGAKYTKVRTPVKLLYSEKCDDRSTALKREFALKSLTRTQKTKLISSSVT